VNRAAHAQGEVIRRVSKLTVVLQLVAAGLLIVLASVYLDISQRYSSLRDGIRENAMWSVYQLDREARRLSETATIALAKNDLGEAQMKAQSLRYDILYSRMTMFEKAKFEKTFTIDDAVEAHLATLQRIIYDNTGIFDDIAAGKPISHASLTTLSFEFEELTRTTDDLLGYVNTVLSTGRADTRDAVMALERKSGFLIGLLVVSVVVLIVTLRRQLKTTRAAGLSLEAMTNELRTSYTAAEAGNRAKSQFMATIGHEVRTPLNAILGMVELLELESLPARAADNVRTIRRSGEALLEIINEILDFAKIEHGKLELECRPVEIGELIMATADMMHSRAAERGNRLEVALPAKLTTPVICSDPTRLRQVLLNLLSNAIKFTENGTVSLAVTEFGRAEARSMRIEVSDTGIGINEDGIATLFQPFSQVDASITRRYGGTGLGLTICKEIVERLGGEIGVDSRRGEGSRFWFTFPVRKAEKPLVSPAADIAITALPRLDVLIVEDNSVNRQVAGRFLDHLGQQVTFAEDGKIAVELASVHRFDLILMDMQMPVMDGIEATARIRGGGPNAATAIVAMTANASDDDRRLCLEAGMNGFQSKPITMPQLRQVLADHAPAGLAPMENAFPPKPASDDRTDVNIEGFERRRAEIVDVLGEEAFEELLADFFDDAASVLSQLLRSVAGPENAGNDRLLHTLKGAAANVGLTEIAALSDSLRSMAVTDGDIRRLSELVETRKRRLAV